MVVALAGLSGAVSLCAHVAERASVQETVTRVVERLLLQLRPFELYSLTLPRLERFLTASERQTFATEHITFRINVPVTAYVVRAGNIRETPFWLRERRFTELLVDWKEEKVPMRVWQRDFEAGPVHFGVNSLSGSGSHYFVLLAPKFPEDAVILSDLQPAKIDYKTLKNGTKIYADRDDVFTAVPERFAGYTLVQTLQDRVDDGRIRTLFRWTDHSARSAPDQIVLTWSGDPRTTQTIQWRTSDRVRRGSVRYGKKSEMTGRKPNALEIVAKSEALRTELVVNDSVVRHHTAVLTGLEAGTTYSYSVGDPGMGIWSAPADFTTAPAGEAPFSFIYMGDAQNGLNRWGALLRDAHRTYPEAAFYTIAGDLVNRGHERDDWDDLLYNARGVFDRRTFIPVIGNHDCIGGRPTLYLRFFDLPNNGPSRIEKERAYSFEYSNAFFVVLDSNLAPETQSAWLDQQLAGSKATWKFASFHHPAYSSAPQRDNEKIREIWSPIFEKHGVDFVLQGHDHAYMRTLPMKNGVAMDSPAKGPIYIVSVSGTKMYKQNKLPYTVLGMTNTSTYQVFQINGNRLSYRAHDSTGRIRDELAIEKTPDKTGK